VEEDLAARGAEVRDTFWITHSVHAVVDSDQLDHVAARADVLSLTAVKPLPLLALDVSRPKIRATQVEGNLGVDGTGVTVAVLDTGVDDTHPALTGGVVVGHQDFTGEGVGDMNGHGTHCAGVVASRDATFRGIAPGAQILDIKHLNSVGNGTEPNGLAAIQAAIDAGVDVASNSWGASHADGAWLDPPAAGQPDGTCSFCQAANRASDAGVVFVVAAGNDDNDSCATYDTHIGCPGLAANAITIGASDDDDDMADFSSIGPTPDGRAKPDVTAPGVDIVSARAAGTSAGSPVDDNWTEESGTSMATPHVAGLAALILQKNPALTPVEVKDLIIGTAVDIGATPEEMGAGRVDALDAVTAA
jgi:serine protease AprX